MPFGIIDSDRQVFRFVVYTTGAIEIPFTRMADYQPFADEALREQYRQRINAIEGIGLVGADAVQKRPNISLDALTTQDTLREFLAAADWALRQG